MNPKCYSLNVTPLASSAPGGVATKQGGDALGARTRGENVRGVGVDDERVADGVSPGDDGVDDLARRFPVSVV